ncbi:MAG: DUF349 domain-containing protein [Cytophagia bacterium]|nr:MAG: DUF349 domain-containing protein [Runella sp.]TAG20336.1 MAG: DUF349 domain-containing protein [Cytophagales bacterium]TAG39492.1 MAG: DUF349 domain-containing protein [Cytophagia bacterium]TAG51072.1 MAG: DUF349 domain-containing protein [Runella slithyformis]TAG75348.1 MAG: DUF349 domain-containing protein [Runella slithyformis]
MTSTFTMNNESTELTEHEELTQQSESALEELEVATEATVDYGQLGKDDFVKLAEEQLGILKAPGAKVADFKRVDDVVKKIKPLFEQIKKAQKEEAKQKFVAENESEEGFEFKYDESTLQFEAAIRQIREVRSQYFQSLDKQKDTNFTVKTQLLARLRELIDTEEGNANNPGTSWQEFKKIQDEWQAAGNIASPHNGTLWATYHALIDRYYSNRNIYFELKELDRKKNLTLKTELVVKVEALAESMKDEVPSRKLIEEANQYFEDYKHIGPAPKAEQELLWQRMKIALDVLYNARRAQTEEQKQVLTQNYEVKSKIYEALVPLTSFSSGSINEWNDKTKEVMALQDQWTNAKGQILREEGKELSRKFWAALKTFFSNKGEFFKQLEAKREQNLKLKIELCEQVEAILESADDSGTSTDKIINFQKQWKLIGQVAEKQKEAIFQRFKKACDGYFDRKRNKNSEVEKEFEENLAQKLAIVAKIEAAAQAGEGNLNDLNTYKDQWNKVGFVPKKDMQTTNKRYVDAVNAYVGALGKLSPKEKAQVLLQNEVEMVKSGGDSGQNLQRKEGDIRRKMQQLEGDIVVWRNNIEFFARSKNSEKLRADVQSKIDNAQNQFDDLKRQLKVIQQAV